MLWSEAMTKASLLKDNIYLRLAYRFRVSVHYLLPIIRAVSMAVSSQEWHRRSWEFNLLFRRKIEDWFQKAKKKVSKPTLQWHTSSKATPTSTWPYPVHQDNSAWKWHNLGQEFSNNHTLLPGSYMLIEIHESVWAIPSQSMMKNTFSSTSNVP